MLKKKETNERNTVKKEHTSLHAATTNGKLFAIYAVKFIVILLSEYILMMFMGTCVVPVAVSYLAGASGVTTSTSFIEALTLWFFPSVFFVICLFAVTIFLGYKLYKWICHKFAKSIQKQKCELHNIREIR